MRPHSPTASAARARHSGHSTPASRDVSRAHRLSRRLRAGTVWVNCYDEGGDMSLPFGGYKQSGNGRDKSLHALEKYTELKTTLLKLG